MIRANAQMKKEIEQVEEVFNLFADILVTANASKNFKVETFDVTEGGSTEKAVCISYKGLFGDDLGYRFYYDDDVLKQRNYLYFFETDFKNDYNGLYTINANGAGLLAGKVTKTSDQRNTTITLDYFIEQLEKFKATVDSLA